MSTALLVFARAPVPGACKTRLVPLLGEVGAARLYRAFLDDVLRTGVASGFAVELWCAGDADDRDLAELSARHGACRKRQAEGDLGARMGHALEEARGRHERALLIGSDAPTLPVRLLRGAAAALERAPTVFGPSADGGYWLVGAAGNVPRFDGVRWSTPHALADTLDRNRRAALLEAWYDVDEPEDLRLLRAHLAVEADIAPATRAALR